MNYIIYSMSIIIAVLFIITAKYYKKNVNLGKKNRELLDEYLQEREKNERTQKTIELLSRILNKDENLIEVDIPFFRDKNDGYYLTYQEILKFDFLLAQISFKLIKEIVLIIRLEKKTYYLSKEAIIGKNYGQLVMMLEIVEKIRKEQPL